VEDALARACFPFSWVPLEQAVRDDLSAARKDEVLPAERPEGWQASEREPLQPIVERARGSVGQKLPVEKRQRAKAERRVPNHLQSHAGECSADPALRDRRLHGARGIRPPYASQLKRLLDCLPNGPQPGEV
jgi:hypothetical protein